MSDISTQNLDADSKSPRLARGQLLEAVGRVNVLTQRINTDTADLVLVNTAATVSGNFVMSSDANVQGNLSVQGSLSLGSAGTAGKVLASAGPGNPVTWVDLPAAGDKFKGTSTSNVAIDAVSPKNFVIDTGLSFTAGQSIVVAHDASNYISGTVTSYNAVTGALVVANVSQVGAGTYNTWTVNINGAAGGPGSNGTNGATWYNGTGAPGAGLGVNNDYYINKTNGDYYQKQAGAWTLLGNLAGVSGAAGSQWYTGNGAPDNGTGANTDFYLNKINGDYYQKSAGAWSLQGNLQGPAGSGGGSSTVFGTTSRYQASTTTGQGVTIISSASVKTGLSWARTGTSLVVTDAGHGRSVGERAIVRNVNVTQVDGVITAADTNTFTITTSNTGGTSGTAGAYSMGFTFAFNASAGSITGGTITAPANCDCVLLAIRMHLAANTRSATTFNLTVPKGNVNGTGPHTGMDDVSIPIQQVRQDGNSLSAVGATISTNTGVPGDYGTYQWAALPAVTTGIHITANF